MLSTQEVWHLMRKTKTRHGSMCIYADFQETEEQVIRIMEVMIAQLSKYTLESCSLSRQVSSFFRKKKKTSFFIKGMKYKRIRPPECHSTHSLYHFRCNEHSAVDHKGIAKGIRYCQLVIASNARALFSFSSQQVMFGNLQSSVS
jgi:hypothetical protein